MGFFFKFKNHQPGTAEKKKKKGKEREKKGRERERERTLLVEKQEEKRIKREHPSQKK